jgi:GNAT superfamily N-acetyltransferase
MTFMLGSLVATAAKHLLGGLSRLRAQQNGLKARSRAFAKLLNSSIVDESMIRVSVRRAVPEDAEVAIAVVRDSITRLCVADHRNDPSALEPWLRNKTADNFVRWVDSADNHVVVAEIDSVVGGVASLRGSGEIQLCYVAPDRQRLGIGTALLVALETQARASGMHKLVLNSTVVARPFYERRGFTPSGAPVPEFGTALCFPYEKAILPVWR